MSQRNRARNLVKLNNVSMYKKKIVDVIGVIVEFTIPRRSKGSDYVTTLKLIDESQQSTELCVNVFAANIDQLPRIRSHQDIILFTDIRIEMHEQQPSAVFRKNSSSFALFDGKDKNSFSHFQASTTFFSLDSDREIIRWLRDWCLSFRYDAGVGSSYVVSIKDIKEGFLDVVCKIEYVGEVSNNVWMLFIWDGTDAPMLSLDNKDVYAYRVGEVEQDLLPLHIEQMPLPANVLSKFPRVGTVLRVVADKAYRNLDTHFESIGPWVKIRNLLCEVHKISKETTSEQILSGIWKGTLMPTTKIRPLSVNDISVQECLRNNDDRILKWSRVPLSCRDLPDSLTITDHQNVEFATLMDVSNSPEDYVVFKCFVRVVSVYPSRVEDFWSDSLLCYRIRMTLEDPTDRIHALLCGHDAKLFFEGCPTLDLITTKMNKLLGVPEPEAAPRNPPWTQCCIEVLPGDEEDALGRKQYHIHDTRLA